MYSFSYWIPLFLTILALWLMFHLHNIYTHLKEFPTTPFIPIVGHIFDYVDPKQIFTHLTAHLQEKGGTIRQFIGPLKPGLITADKNLLQFLCNNNKYVSKAKYYKFMKPWLGEGLITSNGVKWLSRRKALTETFTKSSVLKSFISIFDKKSDLLLAIMEKHEEKPVDVHPILKLFTLDVICEAAMGISMHCQEAGENLSYAKSIDTLCEVIQNRVTSFWKTFDFFFRFSRDYLREKSALKVVDEMLETIISKKLSQEIMPYKSQKDMLDILMEITINEIPLSKEDIREEINTIVFAGYDTTSTALSLFIYEIARHPTVQVKLYEEQKAIFKDNVTNAVGTYENLMEMSYLEAVIMETLRLHTIIPFVGKKVTKDLTYDGITIPAMLNIIIFIHGFHHNPDYFSSPDQFKPDRFTSKNNIENFTYIPFGIKPRQCLGKNFAMLQMKYVLSKIIRNFEVIAVPERPLKLEPKLVLFSSSGIWVSMKKRTGYHSGN